MDKTRIIQQGELAKFKVEIANFDMEANDFHVELIYSYRQTVITITKEELNFNRIFC